MGHVLSGSAENLVASIRRYTINEKDVLERLETLLEDHEALVTGDIVTFAMRNIGKRVGEEVEVGSPTEQLDNLGYPEKQS